ncbi:rod shape-determining protein [Hydrogenoanaerobacterium sp.]|uniref:rod shape-determining protein n=1 Tax=Hydrogenoanaerobacterium sp. TaxID=2953763 RepID=UPI0028979151|nr:rod shape-determining protein [Hydrogenoanaerobacterium sp.]
MSNIDIGIDLGTTSVIIYTKEKGICLKEPSVVAVNAYTGELLAVGTEAALMLGKTPGKIKAVCPLADGVIADYELCEKMVKFFLKKVSENSIVKPRVAICVPSGITDVESRAVVEAAVVAGARKVFLVEEPVAAAIGAGIDLNKANGNIILDIGGGTTDVAVLSLNGIVTKMSLKIAGNKFDDAIIKYIRDNYNVLIGQRTAESIKIGVGSVAPRLVEAEMEFKGRNLISGLPQKRTVKRSDIREVLMEPVIQILQAVRSVIERTPPELVGDMLENGIVLTGGGAKLNGLPELVRKVLKLDAYLAPYSEECVAIGAGKLFDFTDDMSDGIIESILYPHH